ncbi:MAG: monovalent cation/H(+) antiporter subunit G [Candidatus Acetothermia bacterium]|jgi:multicomponent Na+:H+ antiporter subunit G|nr:monovalent cation/H(+) antiporter subunit G [Candidatus Acetothermia bacterium]MDH7504752.1 monovalent cation/H(+) antiporter subunit G [Candidatus Acetothermia bacterium]
MSEPIGITLIFIGVLFDLLGCIGLIRLPDVYNRLQAATKTVTLGTCLILTGVAVASGTVTIQIKAMLALALVLIASPTAAHALARGAYSLGVKLWEKSVVDRYGEDLGKEGEDEAA